MKKSRLLLALLALTAFAGAGYAAVSSSQAKAAADDCCSDGAACCMYTGCCHK